MTENWQKLYTIKCDTEIGPLMFNIISLELLYLLIPLFQFQIWGAAMTGSAKKAGKPKKHRICSG